MRVPTATEPKNQCADNSLGPTARPARNSLYLAIPQVVLRGPPKLAFHALPKAQTRGPGEAPRFMSREPSATAKMSISVLRFEPGIWRAPHPNCTLLQAAL